MNESNLLPKLHLHTPSNLLQTPCEAHSVYSGRFSDIGKYETYKDICDVNNVHNGYNHSI